MEISKISPTSWIDPRLEVRDSLIHGKGIFARDKIRAGEIVIVWGGTLFSHADICSGKALEHSWTTIDEGVVLGHTPEQGHSTDDFINHSCEPNIWMVDEITLAARIDIAAGDELTADFIMWWDPDEENIAWECHCGAQACRKIFTSRDWRKVELQRKYDGHVVPYIRERFEHLYPEYCSQPQAVS